MKVRFGLVSNSSAMSFCIYGWTPEDLKIDETDDPWVQWNNFRENLQKKYPEFKFEDFHWHPRFEGIFGVGNSDFEFDHYLPEHEYWEDRVEDPPTIHQMRELDEIAKIEGLPRPTLQKETWFG